METLWVVIFAVLAACGFFTVCWLAFGAMLLPIRSCREEKIFICLQVAGSDPDLAETVRGLAWLRQGVANTPTIMIFDAGMDERTLDNARRLAAFTDGLVIVPAKELEQSEVWKNKTGS